MGTMNRVYLLGNLVRDPELKRSPAGTAVGEFRIAVTDTYKTRSGEMVEKVAYVDIVVWGGQAEASCDYLQKGSPVLVEGRLQFDEWEVKGQTRNKLRVRADRVQFLGRPRQGSQAAGGSRSARVTSIERAMGVEA